ncbi:MAG: hypothetical protein EBR02_01630 [Alphaproteobacteria bacterium]|nr:hypothetical protein [Alphaproteobacteria bacterium]
MAVKPSMAEAFKEAREKGGFNLDEFGTIIEWGEGEQIPAEVEARMIRDHGIDPDYENKLIQALEEKRKGNA